MELKTAAISLGIGVVAGAAAVMLMPKQSKPYQVANDVVQSVKDGVEQVSDTIRGS